MFFQDDSFDLLRFIDRGGFFFQGLRLLDYERTGTIQSMEETMSIPLRLCFFPYLLQETIRTWCGEAFEYMSYAVVSRLASTHQIARP
jgi:hypothetical protein